MEGLGLNGNNFISETKIDESVFEGNCSTVKCVSSSGETHMLSNAELQQQKQYVGLPGYWISFKTKTAEELEREEILSKIDYLAMMTDVTMEGSDE